jgi:hypothetical protein
MSRILPILVVMTMCLHSWCFAQPESPDPKELKLQLDVQRAEARKGLGELQAKYDLALQQLEAAEQKKGNLPSVIAIREERDRVRNAGKLAEPVSTFPKLAELRDIYERELGRIQSEIISKDLSLLDTYANDLEGVMKELTRKGDIDAALQVSGNIKATRAEMEALEGGSVPRAMNDGSGREVVVLAEKVKRYELNERCKLTKENGRFVLTTDVGNAPLTSQEKFRPPFRLQAKAETKGSLRFYFGQSGIVIFNWDSNPKQLRVGDPGTPLSSQQGYDGEGELIPGRTYEIEIRVEKETITVLVDGTTRALLAGDFTKAEGPVGIGPSFGSTVWVDYFKAFQEEQKE